MKYDLHRPAPGARPLVAGTEASDPSRNGPEDEERDEAIIRLLREKLRWRRPDERTSEGPANRSAGAAAGLRSEDKYEPQRLSRKICWQYDSSARKVPMLRRPYI